MPTGPTIGSQLGHLPLLILACPPAVIVPLPRQTAPLLAIIVPIFRRTAPQRPPANMEGGGGGLPDNRENISQEYKGSDSDAISLLPAEDIPGLPQESKFRVFQKNINKTSESLASPLPEDMASCFNTTYHKTSLEGERATNKHPPSREYRYDCLDNKQWSVQP